MIGFYKMSLVGDAHLADKNPVCQDANAVKMLANGWVIAAIADGLGSAKYSDVGSRTAVEVVACFVEEHLPDKWHDESLKSVLRTAYHAAFKSIKKIAAQREHNIKEYDTTLTTLIYNGTNVVYGHVGDGGIIALSPYGDFSVLTTAQKGEEFNMVVPLRMGPDNWIFGTARESACALLMMTDGIYDIACPWLLAKQKPPVYVNYVRRFMDTNTFAVKTASDFENAETEIKSFFTSKDSKQITDDKTIVGIINTDVTPEKKPEQYYAEPDFEALAKEHQKQLYERKADKQEAASPQKPAPVKPAPAPSPASKPVNTGREPKQGQKIDTLAKSGDTSNVPKQSVLKKRTIIFHIIIPIILAFIIAFIVVLLKQQIENTTVELNKAKSDITTLQAQLKDAVTKADQQKAEIEKIENTSVEVVKAVQELFNDIPAEMWKREPYSSAKSAYDAAFVAVKEKKWEIVDEHITIINDKIKESEHPLTASKATGDTENKPQSETPPGVLPPEVVQPDVQQKPSGD
jgi:serine/threonine protein phosphatase PrpC